MTQRSAAGRDRVLSCSSGKAHGSILSPPTTQPPTATASAGVSIRECGTCLARHGRTARARQGQLSARNRLRPICRSTARRRSTPRRQRLLSSRVQRRKSGVPMRQKHSRQPQEKRSQNRAGQVHEAAVAVGACGRGRSASSLCMFVRGSLWLFADAHFVLVHQQVMIFCHSGLFADCRKICCDSVATDGKRDRKWPLAPDPHARQSR